MDATSASIWTGDLLGRQEDARFLYNFLIGQTKKRENLGRPGSYVLNIDSNWGGGKTFFLQRFGHMLEGMGHVVVRVNAWRDDYVDDPHIALMAAIDDALQPYVKKKSGLRKAWDMTKREGGSIVLRAAASAAKGMTKKYLGVSTEELVGESAHGIADDLTNAALDGAVDNAGKEIERVIDSSVEKLIAEFHKTGAATAAFKSRLSATVEKLKSQDTPAPLFILVDELDRCKPSYAVNLLERVKHLFDVDNVVFVFATNSTQLKHSIAGFYGTGFDGFAYLKRFFDRTYVFAQPTLEQYVRELCKDIQVEKIRAPHDDVVGFIASGSRAFDLDLRAIGHVVEIMDATVAAWTHRPRIDLLLLFPLCAWFYRTGDLDWGSIDIPSHWILPKLLTNRFEQGVTDRSFSVAKAYKESISAFDKMRKIIDLSQKDIPANNVTLKYVTRTFEPEWNGMQIAYEAPSIQAGLLQLVANAGRTTSA